MARITRYTPSLARNDFLWPMSRLHQEMNRLFSDTLRGFDEEGAASGGEWTFSPVVDVEQQNDRYEITAELPGVTLNDINVEMNDDMLVISGSKERKKTTGEGEQRQSERIYGSFRRAFQLPDDAVEDRVNARFADGVLTVTIPRDEEQTRVSSRRIQIEDASSGGDGGSKAES
jgi:HSP20 family protein